MSDDPGTLAANVLASLAGKWHGGGGVWTPSMEPRDYEETVVFTLRKPGILEYWQRSTDAADGSILHGEAGVWRVTSEGRVEIAVALAGATEISEGTIAPDRIDTQTTAVGRATTSLRFAGLARHYALRGNTIAYEFELATVSYPLSSHLRGELRRVLDPAG